jgi:hypothetical protein
MRPCYSWFRNALLFLIPKRFGILDSETLYYSWFRNALLFLIPKRFVIRDSETLCYSWFQNALLFLIPKRFVILDSETLCYSWFRNALLFLIPKPYVILDSETLCYSWFRNALLFLIPKRFVILDSETLRTVQKQAFSFWRATTNSFLHFAHRYLMTRLSLQVVYLWRHVSSTAPPLILWWSNLEIPFGPLHRSSPFIGGLRCQTIQMEHGPYIAERTQNAGYIVRCLWFCPVSF